MGTKRNWTQDEIEYLREHWGYKSINAIGKALDRPFHGVNVKAKRLKLGSAYSSGEYLTARQVSYLLGIDVHAVTDYWIPKCDLKARHKTMTAERKMWLIRFEDLVLWLKANEDKWDSRRVELYALGQEDTWLCEKRQRDKVIAERRFQKWTPHEDGSLIGMFKRGAKKKEIAVALNRSISAVEHRLTRLDVWGTGRLKNSGGRC